MSTPARRRPRSRVHQPQNAFEQQLGLVVRLSHATIELILRNDFGQQAAAPQAAGVHGPAQASGDGGVGGTHPVDRQRLGEFRYQGGLNSAAAPHKPHRN